MLICTLFDEERGYEKVCFVHSFKFRQLWMAPKGFLCYIFLLRLNGKEQVYGPFLLYMWFVVLKVNYGDA